MTLLEDKKECCGCEACKVACPKKAINIIEDENGFKYPRIDSSKCIGCNACYRVCPIKNISKSSMPIVAYVATNKNEKQWRLFVVYSG